VTLVVIEEQGGKGEDTWHHFCEMDWFLEHNILDDDQTWLVAYYVVASNKLRKYIEWKVIQGRQSSFH
jgi:hypothetical protein